MKVGPTLKHSLLRDSMLGVIITLGVLFMAWWEFPLTEGLEGKFYERNEPALLPEIAAAVANLFEVSPAVVAEETTAAARRLYRLPS